MAARSGALADNLVTGADKQDFSLPREQELRIHVKSHHPQSTDLLLLRRPVGYVATSSQECENSDYFALNTTG